MGLHRKLNRNLEFSKKICDELNNKLDKDSDSDIYYEACASNCDVGVRQVLDSRGLHYNQIYFKDSIKTKSIEEIIDLVKSFFVYGLFHAVYPTDMEIKLYDRLTENQWEFQIDEGILYINNVEISVEDITFSDITKDYIEIIEDDGNYCYKTTVKKGHDAEQIEIEKDDIQIPFYVCFSEESEDVYVKDLSSKDINFKIANDGLAYAVNGELHLDDAFGDCVICELEEIENITYLTSANEYIIKFKNKECGFLNQFGFEM